MREADSNGTVTPRRCGFCAFELAQVKPILLLFIEEGIFESKRLLCELLVPCTRSSACESSQGPAHAGYAMSKAAHSFRRDGIDPVSLSVSMLSALDQKISELRSDADVSFISCFAGQHQQRNDGPCTS